MKIGELAQLSQCTVETVRYYEREGLLPAPERSASNYRQYGAAHVERLRLIRNCRSLDMSHEEIRQLLGLVDQPQAACAAVNAVFDQHLAHVEARIAELQQLKATLASLRLRCAASGVVDACGILHGLAELEQLTPERHTHLG